MATRTVDEPVTGETGITPAAVTGSSNPITIGVGITPARAGEPPANLNRLKLQRGIGILGGTDIINDNGGNQQITISGTDILVPQKTTTTSRTIHRKAAHILSPLITPGKPTFHQTRRNYTRV